LDSLAADADNSGPSFGVRIAVEANHPIIDRRLIVRRRKQELQEAAKQAANETVIVVIVLRPIAAAARRGIHLLANCLQPAVLAVDRRGRAGKQQDKHASKGTAHGRVSARIIACREWERVPVGCLGRNSENQDVGGLASPPRDAQGAHLPRPLLSCGAFPQRRQ